MGLLDSESGINPIGEGGLGRDNAHSITTADPHPTQRNHTPHSGVTPLSQSDTVIVAPTASHTNKYEEVYVKPVEPGEVDLGPLDQEPPRCEWKLVQPQLTFKGDSLNGLVGQPLIKSRKSKENYERR